MSETKAKDQTGLLLDAIVKGIQEKKGKDIVSLHLSKIQSTVCDYFIVCHGTSRTHVNAIGDSVEHVVKINTGLNPRRREGMANAEWVLLDYLDVVVHVFQEPVRQFYQLEQLWADAPSEKFESD
ncbi:MAG: ribosome silencing factor [Bacteroidales bacterium]